MTLTTVNPALLDTQAQYTGFKNRIINGAMVIDQRNAGAAITQSTANQWPVDRFIIYGSVASKFTAQQNAGSVTPPAGFKNYLGITSLSAYSIVAADIFVIQHKIEGFNIADFDWGTANAQPGTLSFWVRSSLTGTFGGALGGGQTYPFTYTINAANTWEQKTLTIQGSTSGTWNATNTVGVDVRFGLGVGSTYSQAAGAWTNSSAYSATGATSVVGTNGATFQVTGVQLEKGSTATSFDYRPYGTELGLCQRYFYFSQYGGMGTASSAQNAYMNIPLPVVMRSTPSVSLKSGPITLSDLYVSGYATSTATVSVMPSSTGPVSAMVSIQNGWSPTLNTARPLAFSSNTSPAVDGAFLLSSEL